MKNLTLALLLSCAPAALIADTQPCLLDVAPEIVEACNKCNNGCDRAENVDAQAPDKAVLKVLDNASAETAQQVTVSIANKAVDVDMWEKINQYGAAVYGEPASTDAQSVQWVFKRDEQPVAEWFALLSNVEAIFVAVRSTVVGTCGDDNVTVTIELN